MVAPKSTLDAILAGTPADVAKTKIICALMLDTKGPEIRTGMLDPNHNPLPITAGQPLTLTTDYAFKGNGKMLAVSYEALARDVAVGAQILIADGSLVLKVQSTDTARGTVDCVAMNSATIGERKNVNLPGVVVDLPTVTEKDVNDIRGWAVPNQVDFIAAS